MLKRNPLPAFLTALIALIFVTAAIPARAQLTLTFDKPALAGANGATLTFSGIITNTSAGEIFLNGDNSVLPGDDLTADDTPFVTNFISPAIPLQPSQSVSGELFTVFIGADAAPDIYPGTFTILGGPTDADQTELVTQSFTVTVAPEPTAGALLTLGLLTGAGIALRRRRA